MPYLLALVGSALFEIAVYANRQEKEAIRLRNEKLETEMKFLKSQINPHFLFNSFNTLLPDEPGQAFRIRIEAVDHDENRTIESIGITAK